MRGKSLGRIDEADRRARSTSPWPSSFSAITSIAYKRLRPMPNERALCGHVDNSSRGVKEWGWDPYYPGGAVQGKATDSAMAAKMSFVARAGHPCGEDFWRSRFWSSIPSSLAEAPAAGHEGGSVDRVQRRRERAIVQRSRCSRALSSRAKRRTYAICRQCPSCRRVQRSFAALRMTR